MNVLKNAWFDIAVTLVVGVAVFLGNEVAGWAVMIYTPVMVLLKIAAFTGRHSPSRIKPLDTGIPVIIFHVLYGANVVMLVYGSLRITESWWWVAGCWAVIWILSAATGKGKAIKKAADSGQRTADNGNLTPDTRH